MAKSISYSEIPAFLKNAVLFKDLDPDDNSTFALPFYIENDNITSLYELFVYFTLIDFCLLDESYISEHIYEYVFTHRSQIRQHSDELLRLIILNYKEIKYLVEISDYIDAENSKDIVHFCLINNYFNCFKILINSTLYAWDEDTIILAINTNKLEYLKYLYNSCDLFGYNSTFPWSYHTIYAAIDSGNIECLKYIFDNNCINKLKIPTNALCNRAFIFKRYNILDYLQEHGFTWNCNYFVQLKISDEYDEMTHSAQKYKCKYKNLIMQNIVNDIIFGRNDYGLQPLTLNEIISRIINNQEKIDIAIDKLINNLLEHNFEHLINSMKWLSEELYYTTEPLIND